MIAHVVLFRPKPELSANQQAALVDALEQALCNIPLIKRAHLGRRVVLGRLYDAQNSQQFPFAAILEFANQSDLLEYLEHPAHQALGEQFYSASEAALVFDFDLLEPERTGELLNLPDP